MTTYAVVLGGGGLAGFAWEVGLLVGLADTGVDVRDANLFVGTSAGSVVATLATSGRSWEELFQRQVDPALQSREVSPQVDFQKIIDDFGHAFEDGGSSAEILRRIGALSLAFPYAISKSERRNVIASRLPVDSWPKNRVEVVAVDAISGERTVFTKESGVNIVDAVTASCALSYIWPTATIGDRKYIDGGFYSMANLDLAAGFDRVLVLQPDVPPFPVIETLDEQRARL